MLPNFTDYDLLVEVLPSSVAFKVGSPVRIFLQTQ
jgi:hypothetical protein